MRNHVVQHIVGARQRGYTEWILRAAIENPNVIIVSPDTHHSAELKERFEKMVENLGFFRRWKFNRKKIKPIFTGPLTLNDHLPKINRPIVPDNSIFPDL